MNNLDDFSSQLRALVGTCEDKITQGDLAATLSAMVGIPISQVVLSNWLRGATPRRNKTFDVQAAVLGAMAEIAKDLKHADQLVHDTSSAQAYLKELRADGLNTRLICVAGEINIKLLTAWETPGAYIDFARFIRFKTLVESYRGYLAEVKELNEQMALAVAQATRIKRDAARLNVSLHDYLLARELTHLLDLEKEKNLD